MGSEEFWAHRPTRPGIDLAMCVVFLAETVEMATVSRSNSMVSFL